MKRALAAFTCILLIAAAAPAQQHVLLDRPLRAGELILFPDLNDANVFYYVNDKPTLARGADGRPEFSFLRWVDNVRTAADQPGAIEGNGGGIIHALVSLSVSPDQLREARNQLQQLKPGATIRGPVMFKAGRFSLVTSAKDPAGGLVTQVVGLGNAPLLDGEKAAVSMLLTKQGAKVLWESFKTPTPDISFSFEMEMAGYTSPHRALIEANFDQIYEHTGFSAGIASTYLAGEIRSSFDDLQRTGAIKLTQIGADEKLDALVNAAYTKLTEIMFNPVGGTGTPSLDSLTGAAGGSGPSLLDRASTMLVRSREETVRENERIRRENREAEERERASQPAAGGTPPPAGGTPRPAAAREVAPGDRPAADAAGAGEGEPVVASVARTAGVGRPQSNPPGAPTRSGSSTSNRQQEQSAPAFAIVAAFEMKRVRQRGAYSIDLNKFNSTSITLRFDSNIGNVAQAGDERHFRQVNLDDALFRQREIQVFLDGVNATDFGQFVNFATVRLRKRHQAGDETNEEVRIDRVNFNREGNAFKLLYGWKGDDDRRRWMNYEYQTVWSFFGGRQIEQPWQSASAGAINLAPPLQRRVIDVQADPGPVAEAGVRAITVKIFYNNGGTSELTKQVTLNPARNQLSERIEFLLPGDSYDYAYEVTWRLRGDRTVTTGRRTGNSAVLFVDELPSS